MIRIAEPTDEFGDNRVLKGIDLEVARGEAPYVLGPSGAGKSTLLRCLNGLYWPSSGSVWIGEVKLERGNLAAIRRRVGFIFQGYQLISNRSVLHNVLIGRLAEKPGWSLIFSKRDVHLARETTEAVSLGEKVHTRVSELSGGQKQRVGIARTLVRDSEVLLADEPTSSLDPVTSGSRLQVIVFGVIPQVLAHAADFTLYRWEMNFRASTVVGMVGAGGIGFELLIAMRLTKYQQAAAVLLSILLIVQLVDQFGNLVGSRLVGPAAD